MVRRIKEVAQATRSHLLDTAELVFAQRGVSGTSLAEIAKTAGLTRGAIYWHFTDKADLFNAMMDRVILPLEYTGRLAAAGSSNAASATSAASDSSGRVPTAPKAQEASPASPPPSLAQMRARFVAVLERVVADPQVARVFGIATHKVEYVGEMNAVRARHVSVRNACLAEVEATLDAAMRRGELTRQMPAPAAAIGLHALLDGLLQNWMLDPQAFKLVRVGTQVLDAYLAGLAADAAD